jgi:DNA-binding MarR family transcriptional regulator
MEYLAGATGLSRSQVVRLISDLARRKEITKLRHPYQSNSYSVPWATARALRKKWAIAKNRTA